jgi:tetratricopeptide (TPR) repeat protein
MKDKAKGNPDFWNNLAICHILENKFYKAKLYLKTGLALARRDQTRSKLLNNLGVIYQKNENWQQAFESYDSALKLAKDNAYAIRKNLNSINLKFYLVNRSLDEFDSLVRSRPKDPAVLYGIGTSYLFIGKDRKAKSYYDRIKDSEFKKRKHKINYALTFGSLGLPSKAFDMIRHTKKADLPLVNKNHKILYQSFQKQIKGQKKKRKSSKKKRKK